MEKRSAEVSDGPPLQTECALTQTGCWRSMFRAATFRTDASLAHPFAVKIQAGPEWG